jgi:hypothetical protein
VISPVAVSRGAYDYLVQGWKEEDGLKAEYVSEKLIATARIEDVLAGLRHDSCRTSVFGCVLDEGDMLVIPATHATAIASTSPACFVKFHYVPISTSDPSGPQPHAMSWTKEVLHSMNLMGVREHLDLYQAFLNLSKEFCSVG